MAVLAMQARKHCSIIRIVSMRGNKRRGTLVKTRKLWRPQNVRPPSFLSSTMSACTAIVELARNGTDGVNQQHLARPMSQIATVDRSSSEHGYRRGVVRHPPAQLQCYKYDRREPLGDVVGGGPVRRPIVTLRGQAKSTS